MKRTFLYMIIVLISSLHTAETPQAIEARVNAVDKPAQCKIINPETVRSCHLCPVKPKISDPLEEAPQLTAECIICYEEKHLMQQPEGCECTNKNYCFDCFIRTVIAQPIITCPCCQKYCALPFASFPRKQTKDPASNLRFAYQLLYDRWIFGNIRHILTLNRKSEGFDGNAFEIFIKNGLLYTDAVLRVAFELLPDSKVKCASFPISNEALLRLLNLLERNSQDAINAYCETYNEFPKYNVLIKNFFESLLLNAHRNNATFNHFSNFKNILENALDETEATR